MLICAFFLQTQIMCPHIRFNIALKSIENQETNTRARGIDINHRRMLRTSNEKMQAFMKATQGSMLKMLEVETLMFCSGTDGMSLSISGVAPSRLPLN